MMMEYPRESHEGVVRVSRFEGMGVVEGSPAFLLFCCRHTDTFGDAGTEFTGLELC